MNNYLIGLDIGGANLKAASTCGDARSIPFALWQHPDELAQQLKRLIDPFETPEAIGVTMTGELCDCFTSKQEGVAFIVDAVQRSLTGSQIHYYQVGGGFVDADTANRNWKRTSASNWYALAEFVATNQPMIGNGVVLDIGSTTVDLLPIMDGNVATASVSDLDRLKNGELLYTGVARTPVCSVIDRVKIEDGRQQVEYSVPVSAEVFATMSDVYVILGSTGERPDCHTSCDGRSLTRFNSLRRLARCFCSEPGEMSEQQLVNIAEQIAQQQLATISEFVHAGLSRINPSFKPLAESIQPNRLPVVLAGEGEFVAKTVVQMLPIETEPVSLQDSLGSNLSKCAPAFAAARLLQRALVC